MAIGKQSDFQIYQDQFYGGFVETIQQNISAFNEASAGAIRLIDETHPGNYQQEGFFDVTSSLITRRDTTSVSAAADLALTSDEFVGVKLDRKIGPVAQTFDAWKKISRDPEELSFIMGQQVARALPQEMLNTALAACEAKLDAVAALEEDDTGAIITSEGIVDAMSKVGDASGNLAAFVMHSKVYHDLLKDQVADAVYRADGVSIMQGTPASFGRPVIVTDSSSLVETDGVSSGIDAYSSLLLFRDAIVCKNSEPRDVILDLVSGLENLVYRFQGEYSYTLSLRGCQWDVANGGANPNGTTIATATNWDSVVADNKLLPGSILKTR